jgi:hypothetical protein
MPVPSYKKNMCKGKMACLVEIILRAAAGSAGSIKKSLPPPHANFVCSYFIYLFAWFPHFVSLPYHQQTNGDDDREHAANAQHKQHCIKHARN